MDVHLDRRLANQSILTLRGWGFYRHLLADDPVCNPSHYRQDVRGLSDLGREGRAMRAVLTNYDTGGSLSLYPMLAAYTIEGVSAHDVLEAARPTLENGPDRPHLIVVGRLDAEADVATHVPPAMRDSHINAGKWDELARDTWRDCKDAMAANRVDPRKILGAPLMHYLIERHLYNHEILFYRWAALQGGWFLADSERGWVKKD